MRQKGFTLVELLAVIVILAIILAIAIPSILNIVDNAKREAFMSNAKLVFKALDYKKLEDEGFDLTSIKETNIETELNIEDDNYESLNVTIKNNRLYIIIKGSSKWEGLVAYGERNTISVVTEEEYAEKIPIITLIGSNPMVINLNGTYGEQGGTAIDSVDGDLTDNIVITGTVNTTVVGIYAVTYSVINSLGNTSIITRIVTVRDNMPPVLTMLGDSEVTINQDTTYVDLGATALDNYDGDITGSIETVSTVNTSVVGLYSITYHVSDSSGNAAIPLVRTVNVISGSEFSVSEGVNRPRLTTGMTAVKWNSGTGMWDSIENPYTDTSWYDYANKEWANAMTEDGSMWVWIPRYAYQIATLYHSTSITAGSINVKFLKDTTLIAGDNTIAQTTATYSGSSQTNYIVHPAFTFVPLDLTGIWIAKFEASGAMNAIDIKPNVVTLRSQTISSAFTAIRNMETNTRYGWGTTGVGKDTHLLKNVEWGAAAYLSQSTYGVHAQVWINPANNYRTGCAGASVSSSPTVGCTYTYETPNGINASTTGTIYGIYDMSGGSNEYVAAYINNLHNNLNTYGSSLVSANIKYKDFYTASPDIASSNYNNMVNRKGDAIYETSNGYNTTSGSWYSDNSYAPETSFPFILRGGVNNRGISAGVYYFDKYTGIPDNFTGFRVSLIIDPSL